MLAATHQNFHHSKLPAPGAIVTVHTRPLSPNRRFRRYIVEGYPLCDSPDWRYSIGIHTVYPRSLDGLHHCQVAGHFCEEA